MVMIIYSHRVLKTFLLLLLLMFLSVWFFFFLKVSCLNLDYPQTCQGVESDIGLLILLSVTFEMPAVHPPTDLDDWRFYIPFKVKLSCRKRKLHCAVLCACVFSLSWFMGDGDTRDCWTCVMDVAIELAS